jgi:hypothetical protein
MYAILVLAGDSHRFASTHRVSLREGHSYDYILNLANNVMNDVSVLRDYIRSN